jgi:hypothetical protein
MYVKYKCASYNYRCYSNINQMHQFLKFIYFDLTLYMFRTVFPSIIRSSRLCTQKQAYVKQILLLLGHRMQYRTVRDLTSGSGFATYRIWYLSFFFCFLCFLFFLLSNLSAFSSRLHRTALRFIGDKKFSALFICLSSKTGLWCKILYMTSYILFVQRWDINFTRWKAVS